MKKVRLIMAVAVLLAITSMTALAGEWKQDSPGWWWQKDDGSYPANQWQWIDGNNDGIAECYYFDTNGYMLFNTTTPDGYEVNSNGNWVVGGIIQTQSKGVNKSTETGYIKQEYIDVLGKNRDYVISQFGDPEVKSFSTYNINGIISESEDFYYKKETGDELNISFHNNEVGRVYYRSMDTYDFAQEQQIMKKIDNQFGVKSQRTDSNVYIWIISNNPRLELTYFSSGTYTIKLDIWDI